MKSILALMLPPLVAIQAHSAEFNDGWSFHLGEVADGAAVSFNHSTWEAVTLPHTARIEARVCGKDNHQQWEGICWYRKAFTLPREALGQVVLVRFEGAMNRAVLYANGQQIASNTDGYLPLVGDLSPFAKTPGTITLALRLDNASNPITGPKPQEQLDFHLYHGLYRPATLLIKPALHITDEILAAKTGSGGVFVTYPQVSEASATVSTQVHVHNRAPAAARFSLVTRLTERDGTEVARQEAADLHLGQGEDRAFTVPLTVTKPRLWSPQTPHLYHLEVAVVADGTVIERQRHRIGIRHLSFTPGGMVINGKKLFLRGTNRHQEYPYIGNALPDSAQYRDAFQIKQAGFDYVRLSHYPQSPAFMDACDELGIVTMPAILGWQYNAKTEEFHANRVQAARELVRRDRNHPSACLWEVCLNETGMSAEFIQRLNAAAHEEYPGDQMFTAGWVKGYDVKLTSRQAGSTKEFTNITHPAIISEYGDWEYMAKGNDGLHQDTMVLPTGVKETYLISRQTRGWGVPGVGLARQAMNFQEAHNEGLGTAAAGDGVWVMFDYNRGYAKNLETSGVSDLFRIPKYSYAFYQSQRDAAETLTTESGMIGGPMAFIATYWIDKSPLTVRVYSNADEVELFLNDKSLGRNKPDSGVTANRLRHPPFSFVLPAFEPGELHAVAYTAGKPVAEHRVRTPQTAKKIIVTADTAGKPASAGGDVLFLHATVVDEAGTCVPSYNQPLTFSVDGGGTLIGENPIAAEAGIASVLLKTGTAPGSIRITASGGPLQGSLTITTK